LIGSIKICLAIEIITPRRILMVGSIIIMIHFVANLPIGLSALAKAGEEMNRDSKQPIHKKTVPVKPAQLSIFR